MLLFLVVVTVFVAIIICYRKNFSYWNQYKNVASAKGSIFSGDFCDLFTFKTNFGYHLKTIYENPKFTNEPVVGVYGLYQPSLLLKEPELIKAVLIKDFDSFCNRFASSDPHHDPLGSQVLFLARYNVWKELRPKMTPIFSSGKLKNMFPLIKKVGENMETFLGKQKSPYIGEMKDFCARYTTDVISTTVFGVVSNSLENPSELVYIETRKLAKFNLSRALNMLFVFFAPKLSKITKSKVFFGDTEKYLRYTVNFAITERELSGDKRNDLIDIFVKLKQEAAANGEDVAKFVDLLVSQTGIFLIGGFETSSTTLSNILFELAKQPNLQAKLREEILNAFVEDKGEISYETVNKMEYLETVINETLRIYPVLPMLERQYGRASGETKPYSLQPYSDFEIPEGMPVYISPYALHYDPKYWPNPTKFDPERFSSENKHTIDPMVYLPFGNGPHNCVGARLGMLQIKCGLLYLLRNNFVKVCHKTELHPQFEAKAVVLQVKGGVYLEIVADKMCDNALKIQ